MVENLEEMSFDIPDGLLDEIQQNIQQIISDFDVPEENKMEVIKQINYIYTRTKYLSITDELTGLSNRRCFDSTFEKEFLRAQRYNNKLTLVMFDIDHFKTFNDTFGHPAGDKVIATIAKTVSSYLQRSTDFFARYGGEEFVAVSLGIDAVSAFEHLKTVRQAVEDLHIQHNSPVCEWVTISVGGITVQPKLGDSFDTCLKLADTMLYDAKRNGRNRLVWADEKMKQQRER